MDVKQDTRQKLLFATDEFPAIESGKLCCKCNKIKSGPEFYTAKRKNGDGRYLRAMCTQCDNFKRQKNIERVRGPDWVDGNVKRRNEVRVKAAEARDKKRRQKLEEKEAKKNEFGKWTKVIRGAMSHAMLSQKDATKTDWEKKCVVVISGLKKRNPIAIGKGLNKCTTWQDRCKAAKVNLKAVMKRPHQDAWKKKCSTCALNHKRKHK